MIFDEEKALKAFEKLQKKAERAAARLGEKAKKAVLEIGSGRSGFSVIGELVSSEVDGVRSEMKSIAAEGKDFAEQVKSKASTLRDDMTVENLKKKAQNLQQEAQAAVKSLAEETTGTIRDAARNAVLGDDLEQLVVGDYEENDGE